MGQRTEHDVPMGGHVLDLHVASIEQLFNSIDPAPFRERDLDPDAEEFVVG